MHSYYQNLQHAFGIQNHLSYQHLPTVSYLQTSGKLIGLLQGMALLIKKVSYKNENIKVSSKVIYENGSPFYVSQQYKNLFSQLSKDFQKIAYIFQPHKDSFSLNIELTLTPTHPNENFIQFYRNEIAGDLLKLKKIFQILGMAKTKTKFSYHILKNELKLKKTVINTLLSKEDTNSKEVFNRAPGQTSNSVVLVEDAKQVTLFNQQLEQNNLNRKGGYFEVVKKEYEITNFDGSKMERALAVKKPKRISNQQKVKQKIQKQLKIVSQIIDNKYTVNYYKLKQGTNNIYMDYIPFNLKQAIYNDLLGISDIFSISRQLIEGVNILHKSQIVHRDLKLENILVDGINENRKSIKIIDFGESTMFDDKYVVQHNLGCTVPYSPIECMMEIPEGFNKPQIDLWSVIFIIYELAFHRLPFYFNRFIQTDLVNGWREQGQFDTCFNVRPRKGMRKMQQILTLLCQQGLRIQQKERLPLSSTLSAIILVQKFYQQSLGLMKNFL